MDVSDKLCSEWVTLAVATAAVVIFDTELIIGAVVAAVVAAAAVADTSRTWAKAGGASAGAEAGTEAGASASVRAGAVVTSALSNGSPLSFPIPSSVPLGVTPSKISWIGVDRKFPDEVPLLLAVLPFVLFVNDLKEDKSSFKSLSVGSDDTGAGAAKNEAASKLDCLFSYIFRDNFVNSKISLHGT